MYNYNVMVVYVHLHWWHAQHVSYALLMNENLSCISDTTRVVDTKNLMVVNYPIPVFTGTSFNTCLYFIKPLLRRNIHVLLLSSIVYTGS